MNSGTIPMDGSPAGLALTLEGIKLKFKREWEGEATLKTVLAQCLSGESSIAFKYSRNLFFNVWRSLISWDSNYTQIQVFWKPKSQNSCAESMHLNVFGSSL